MGRCLWISLISNRSEALIVVIDLESLRFEWLRAFAWLTYGTIQALINLEFLFSSTLS